MSAREAAGWARSRFQAVSVVPMIQCRPHGITKSTDFSVLVMKPHSERIRSRGTTRWMPLLASTSRVSSPPSRRCTSSVHTPGRVDHDPRAHLEVGAALEVGRPYADHPVALAQEAGDAGAGGDHGTVMGGGPGEGHHQPRVVDLAVVVADRPGELVGAQVGGDPGDLLAEQVLVLGHAHVVLAGHRQRVVQREARADVGPLDGAVQRVEERHRPDQVGREPGEQQPALLQRLADQREVEHLQVAQAAVDQLARPRGRAAGEVPLLEQPDGQATRHGVERRAGADHPAPDDQDVEGWAAGSRAVAAIASSAPARDAGSRALDWATTRSSQHARKRAATGGGVGACRVGRDTPPGQRKRRGGLPGLIEPVDEEVVALYDDGGRPAGSAPRSVMRAQNLRHAATGILVRDPWGRVYVHRRTPTKDVYPAHWDFTAGGVAARRRGPARRCPARAGRGAGCHQRARAARRGRLRRRAHDVPGVPLPDHLGRADHAAGLRGRLRRLAEHRAAARAAR